MNNKGLSYIEVIVGITISALIFWISLNLMSFIFLRDVKNIYVQEFEDSKASLHELISNEIAWANKVTIIDENSFEVDGVDFAVDSGVLEKNGNPIETKNVLVESMLVSSLSSSDELASIQIEMRLKHKKNKSIFDTFTFTVSQRKKSILKK